MEEEKKFEVHRMGERTWYLEGWFTLEKLKEKVAGIEIAQARLDKHMEQAMGVKKDD